MVFVLVIGDFHIPHRANDLPLQFKKMLVPGKITKVFCTGNLCIRETFLLLKKITPDLNIVRGDFDDGKLVAKEARVVELEGWRFGLIHGHQIVPWGDREALAQYQRRMDCDIMIYGHTHECKLFQHEGCHYVNPGSATGAYSGLVPDVAPSFVLMDVQPNMITNYVYQLVGDAVQVKKKIFRRLSAQDAEVEGEESGDTPQ